MTACMGRVSHSSVRLNLPSSRATVSNLVAELPPETVGRAACVTSSVSLSTPVSVPLMVMFFDEGWQAQSSAAPANIISTFFFI